MIFKYRVSKRECIRHSIIMRCYTNSLDGNWRESIMQSHKFFIMFTLVSAKVNVVIYFRDIRVCFFISLQWVCSSLFSFRNSI